jgi:hypothetical protein
MSESTFDEFGQGNITSELGCSISAWLGAQAVSARDFLVSANGNEVYALGVAWFEPYCGACWNIKALSICFFAIKVEERICFDKVIVGANLDASRIRSINRSAIELNGPGLVDHLYW